MSGSATGAVRAREMRVQPRARHKINVQWTLTLRIDARVDIDGLVEIEKGFEQRGGRCAENLERDAVAARIVRKNKCAEHRETQRDIAALDDAPDV